MTSSTEPSRRLRSLAIVFAISALAWALPVAALGALASHAEAEWGAFLWRGEEWMRLLGPAGYAGRGAGRVMVIGPSEAREGFADAAFEAGLPGFEFFNDAISMSTLEDAVTQLEYIERAYGEEAFPEVVLLALTQRYASDYTPDGVRPLPIALNKYSSDFWLNQSVEPQQLVEKHPGAALVALLRSVGHSGRRYQSLLRALRARVQLYRSGAEWSQLLEDRSLLASRFYRRPTVADPERYLGDILEGGGQYPALRSTQPDPAVVGAHFERLRALAAAHGSRVFVLLMPEASWRRAFYEPGIYEAYQSTVIEAAAPLPVMNFREAIPDELYFDNLHLRRQGAKRLSRQVADIMSGHLLEGTTRKMP